MARDGRRWPLHIDDLEQWALKHELFNLDRSGASIDVNGHKPLRYLDSLQDN